MRASDADRETVVARLQAAVGEGRIDLDEFGQRADAAYSATTRAELDLLLGAFRFWLGYDGPVQTAVTSAAGRRVPQA